MYSLKTVKFRNAWALLIIHFVWNTKFLTNLAISVHFVDQHRPQKNLIKFMKTYFLLFPCISMTY